MFTFFAAKVRRTDPFVMANTYTQLYIQIVFAVKYRESLIPPAHRDQLHKYITGIVQQRSHKMLSVFCMPDHAHVFVGMKPAQSISDLTRDIKAASSGFINENKWINKPFQWQNGYGAFSYSRESVDTVVRYILNQEAHHKAFSFNDEYRQLLKEFDVSYDERYLFDRLD